jgi:cysteine-rich repeat protein
MTVGGPAFAGDVEPVCGNGVLEGNEQCDDGNNANWDGCSHYCWNQLCEIAPPQDCAMASVGKLTLQRRGEGDTMTGTIRLELSGFDDVALADFGDPVFNVTRHDVCFYGDRPYPYGELVVARGLARCGEKACWRQKGEESYVYADRNADSWGVKKILLQSSAGGGRISFAAQLKKNGPWMPVMTEEFANDAIAEIRVVTSEGACFGASMTDVLVNTEARFKARIPPIR